MKKPATGVGALAGALCTAALTSVLFLAQRLAGAPFVPYDLFEWANRRIPGAVLTAGIDAMVAVIRALHLGSTSRAAKTAEETMALVAFVVAGAVAGAVLFAVLHALEGRRPLVVGAVLGLLAGLPSLLVSAALRHESAGPAASLWLLVAFVGWGLVLGWVYERLATAAPSPAEDTRAAEETRGEEEAARQRVVEGASDARHAEPDIATDAAPPPWSDLGIGMRGHAERLDRRSFLVRFGGATAAITVAGAVVGELIPSAGARDEALRQGARPWSATQPLPNAGAAVAPVPGTRAELTPADEHYRIDIDAVPPRVDGSDWRLRVGGRVARPVALTLDQLRGFPATDQFITLECISNYLGGDLIGTQRWTGVSLQRLLPTLGVDADASHLLIRSADGFHEVLALETARADPRVMLCYAWDGLPLPTEHGYPLRIYVPDVYGMKQPKWITSIDAVDHAEAGYWVVRGWSERAQIQATSVIDAVRASDAAAGQGRQVAVGGIAYAGARGVSRVAVSVDGGPWRDARLRQPISGTTWVVWRYEWPFRPGRHTFTVRCWDGDGTPQITEPSPPHPDGATGLVSRTVEV